MSTVLPYAPRPLICDRAASWLLANVYNGLTWKLCTVPKAVANYFLSRRKQRGLRPVTQMKLHKLVYFAHGWNLALVDEPLINEMVEAWEYGPVVPTLYHEFKEYGARKITRLATDWNPATLKWDITPEIDADDEHAPKLLDRIIEVYGSRSAVELSALTHVMDSPWTKTVKQHPRIRHVDIPNKQIQAYFKQKLDRSRATNESR